MSEKRKENTKKNEQKVSYFLRKSSDIMKETRNKGQTKIHFNLPETEYIRYKIYSLY